MCKRVVVIVVSTFLWPHFFPAPSLCCNGFVLLANTNWHMQVSKFSSRLSRAGPSSRQHNEEQSIIDVINFRNSWIPLGRDERTRMARTWEVEGKHGWFGWPGPSRLEPRPGGLTTTLKGQRIENTSVWVMKILIWTPQHAKKQGSALCRGLYIYYIYHIYILYYIYTIYNI